MFDVMMKVLFGTAATSGVITVALAQGQMIADPPPAKDPLSWAFMTVIGVVVIGAGWVVRFNMTRNVAATDKLTEAIRRLVEKIDEGFKGINTKVDRNLARVLENKIAEARTRRDHD